MNQLDRARQRLSRVHDELFAGERQKAEFFDYDAGTWNPDTDEITGQGRTSIGTVTVEIVPPTQDTSVDVQGTDISWSTSIRFPEDKDVVGSLTTLGVENERPTEVEITDQQDGTTETFELHSYTTELGSGMIMCRLQG